MPTDYKKLFEGCPLLEKAREDSAAWRAKESRTRDRPRQEAEQKLGAELSERAVRSHGALERFALEAQPELNEIVKQGEAAKNEFWIKLPPGLVPQAKDARDKAEAGKRAAERAVRNVRDACNSM